MSIITTIRVRRDERPLAYDGIVAGIIAGAVVDAFLFATGTLSWPRSYEFVASVLVGKAAFGSSAYVLLGLAMHFAISAGWGALFGVAAQRYRRLLEHPLITGVVFGLIVLIAMQLLLAAAGLWRAPQSAGAVFVDLLAHTVFFGMPIAWYVNDTVRQRAEPARKR